ncbi:hypothetical protein C9374_003301 [Naegleria lovaniensis]|uniref:TRF2-interacting telomeric protein/Rap1 C-terminal domain-containing protein n=1 Tax=Naegleria lovaniensis TaxID=51637 RepID=A0AA88GNP9_NAELO|nr:uncharacterized protein C9374_003301 [Naegleria lovaniensis]KAG2385486.1 hypothetical protein C9374_003301 [Naegleria lovaniensis]
MPPVFKGLKRKSKTTQKRKASSSNKNAESSRQSAGEEESPKVGASTSSSSAEPQEPLSPVLGLQALKNPFPAADQADQNDEILDRDLLQTQQDDHEDAELTHPPRTRKRKKKVASSDDENDQDYAPEEENEEGEEEQDESAAKTPKRKAYLPTTSAYRVPVIEDESDRVTSPPSSRKRAKNFTADEDRLVKRVVLDMYDGVPEAVNMQVFELMSRILDGREGQAKSIKKHYYRAGAYLQTETELRETEEEDNAKLLPFKDEILKLKEIIAEEREVEAQRKRAAQLRDIHRLSNEIDAFNARHSPKRTPKKSPGKTSRSSTPRKSPKSSTPTRQRASSSSSREKDEETIYAEKLIEKLASETQKSTDLVAHALYACSGDPKLAARLLDESAELTENEKNRIWTQEEDKVLTMKGRPLKALIDLKGEDLVQARLAWLESAEYGEVEY